MSGATILVVDDNKMNRAVLGHALELHGYNILQAGDGLEATKLLEENRVDLILLDLVMPKMDGLSFLAWRKERPEYAMVPVIVSSSLDDLGTIQQALALNSYDYFVKPISANDLKMTLPIKIRNAVESKNLYDDLRELNQELKHRNQAYEREIELAGRYQRSLLPTESQWSHPKVATFYYQYSGVAGDFYDLVNVDEHYALFLADVSGHGLMSAMVSSQLKSLVRRYADRIASPAELFTLINDQLLALTLEEDYATAFCAVYNSKDKRLRVAGAGHPEQLFFRKATGQVEKLRGEGFCLGMFASSSPVAEQKDRSFSVQPGDRLMLFTDGANEAFDSKGRQFGMDRVTEAFQRGTNLEVQEAVDGIWGELLDYTGGDMQDDVAILMAEF